MCVKRPTSQTSCPFEKVALVRVPSPSGVVESPTSAAPLLFSEMGPGGDVAEAEHRFQPQDLADSGRLRLEGPPLVALKRPEGLDPHVDLPAADTALPDPRHRSIHQQHGKLARPAGRRLGPLSGELPAREEAAQ